MDTSAKKKADAKEINETKFHTIPVLHNNTVGGKLKKTSQFFSRFASSLTRTNQSTNEQSKNTNRVMNQKQFEQPINDCSEILEDKLEPDNAKQLSISSYMDTKYDMCMELGVPVKIEKTLSNQEAGSTKELSPDSLSSMRRGSSVDRYCLSAALSPLYSHMGGVSPGLDGKFNLALTDDTDSEVSPIDMSKRQVVNTVDVDPEDPKSVARACFRDDNSFLCSTKIIAFLAKPVEFNIKCLSEYMKLMDLSSLKLDEAFRLLCKHLYLQAESQLIDRIIQAFSLRYSTQNQESVFRTADVVHGVSYSLLLLNTDLNMMNSKTRMTKHEFVRNTLALLNEDKIESSFKKRANNSIFTSLSRSISESTTNSKESTDDEVAKELKAIYTAIKNNPIPLKVITAKPFGSRRSVSSVYGHDKRLTKLATSNQLFRLSDNRSESRLGISGLANEFEKIIADPNKLHPAIPDHSESDKYEKIDNRLNEYPYYMVGVLVRKHLSDKGSKKAANRQWRELWCVVHDGCLRMFKPGALPVKYANARFDWKNHREEQRADIFDPQNNGLELTPGEFDGDLGTMPLRHVLAVPLPPPGYSETRPNVLALQMYSGAVFLLQTATPESLKDWTFAINFWAAYTSKPPLIGGVDSIDYGWNMAQGALGSPESTSFTITDEVGLNRNDRFVNDIKDGQPVSSRMLFDDDSKSMYSDSRLSMSSDVVSGKNDTKLHHWNVPQAPVAKSDLRMNKQLNLLNKHIDLMDKDLASHMENRALLGARFNQKYRSSRGLYERANGNWERKSQFLLRELVKYQTFADILLKVLPALIKGESLSFEFVRDEVDKLPLLKKNDKFLVNSASISDMSINSPNQK